MDGMNVTRDDQCPWVEVYTMSDQQVTCVWGAKCVMCGVEKNEIQRGCVYDIKVTDIGWLWM